MDKDVEQQPDHEMTDDAEVFDQASHSVLSIGWAGDGPQAKASGQRYRERSKDECQQALQHQCCDISAGKAVAAVFPSVTLTTA